MMDTFLSAKIAVIGAGGKMGAGISALVLREMTKTVFGAPPNGHHNTAQLWVADQRSENLEKLRDYLNTQLTKWADQKMILCAVNQALGLVTYETDLKKITGCRLIFEAVFENLNLKAKLFQDLKSQNKEAFFLTNTSSIPIFELETATHLHGRILGFHFYNPPVVQKLIEAISTQTTNQELVKMAEILGKKMQKTLVWSSDIAGFIGNGHFIREARSALNMLESLKTEWSEIEAVYMINKVTQDFLIRPMGIFDLISYVGMDVFTNILSIMSQFLPKEKFPTPELFKKIKSATASANLKLDFWLGELPTEWQNWKSLSNDLDKNQKIQNYFKSLKNSQSHGAKLALAYLKNSIKIADKLVDDGVAKNREDVGHVLQLGFYHLYNPWDVL